MSRTRSNGIRTAHNARLNGLVPLLLDWFYREARDLPWRRTRDPYAIWVSEIMLQQTQVNTVRTYWQRWMRALPTVRALAEASPEKIHKLWEGLGYYTRVRNLQKAAQIILRNHGGRFPESFDHVLALPGIGRYTAGAICSIAFDQPTPVLDGNVMRVLTRIFGIETDLRERVTNDRLWNLAQALVLRVKTEAQARPAVRRIPGRPRSPLPAQQPGSEIRNPASEIPHAASALNQSLMELGALICTPQRPECSACPVERLCVARRRGLVDRLPNLRPRAAATRRSFVAFVLSHRGRFLVRQRPAGVVNAHLWEFPNVEVTGAEPDLPTAARDSLGFVPRRLEPLCTIRHSITRYRISLEAFLASERGDRFASRGTYRWLRFFELKRLSFPSAHKRILARVEERSSRLVNFSCSRSLFR